MKATAAPFAATILQQEQINDAANTLFALSAKLRIVNVFQLPLVMLRHFKTSCTCYFNCPSTSAIFEQEQRISMRRIIFVQCNFGTFWIDCWLLFGLITSHPISFSFRCRELGCDLCKRFSTAHSSFFSKYVSIFSKSCNFSQLRNFEHLVRAATSERTGEKICTITKTPSFRITQFRANFSSGLSELHPYPSLVVD